MEARELMEGVEELGNGEIPEEHVGSVTESDKLEIELLKDFDSYWEDIDGCLTVSRMVSTSVIKGMVEAIEKMAEEKIAEKESELARMREKMRFRKFGGDESEGIFEVSNAINGLDSLLSVSLEEMMRFQKLGGEISERISEVSYARNELSSLLRSLTSSESGQLVSQGSYDMDNVNRKLLTSHVSTPPSFWIENGHLEGSKNGLPDSWDVAQFRHLDREGLVGYFNSIIAKMRREHESQVQKMTDDYFILKRDYLKEKGSSLQHRRDKDLENVKRKIPEVISKLDDIIVENEKLSTLNKEAETFISLKDRVSDLFWENHHLKELLADKEKEIKSLTLQVFDDSGKMLPHSLAEENLKKLTGDLESAMEDADIKMFLIHEVYECMLRGLTLNKNSTNEELEMQNIESALDAIDTNRCEIEDSDIELSISQGLCEIIYKEAIMDAKVLITDITINYVHECDNRKFLEKNALEKEKESELVIEENGKLKQELDMVMEKIEEEKALSTELLATLTKERDRLELASYELNSVNGRVGWLESSLNKNQEELDLVKGKLAEALDELEVVKLDMIKAKQKLKLMSEEFKVVNEERNALHAIAQEKQKDIVMLEGKEKEQREQMKLVIGLISVLSREFYDFECRLSAEIKKKNLRLKEFGSHLQLLFKKTNTLRRTTLVYKQQLERKCADLETAETEVDLLGDQVDRLLNLLEKVYIGLDHYSPILQHYPGMMEILKLVRMELSGESVKSK